MAQNYIQPGEVLPVVAPSGGMTTGLPYLFVNLVGISLNTVLVGATGELALTGIWSVAKVTGAAWVLGDLLYWDNTAKNFTKTATSNTLAGYAAEAATSGATTGKILLRQ